MSVIPATVSAVFTRDDTVATRLPTATVTVVLQSQFRFFGTIRCTLSDPGSVYVTPLPGAELPIKPREVGTITITGLRRTQDVPGIPKFIVFGVPST